MQQPEIRRECSSDYGAIRSITEAAFLGKSFAGGDEQDIIERLREKGALSLSLVALSDDIVVAHVAFSPARAADNSQPWFALGPVSVLPECQGNGIGSLLIVNGLAQIAELDALGCILTGNPTYYRRFGFEHAPNNVPPSESKDFFMMKHFTAFAPNGPVYFDQAFYSDV